MTTTTSSTRSPGGEELPVWLDRAWLDSIVPDELRGEIARVVAGLEQIVRDIAELRVQDVIAAAERAYDGVDCPDDVYEAVWQIAGYERLRELCLLANVLLALESVPTDAFAEHLKQSYAELLGPNIRLAATDDQ